MSCSIQTTIAPCSDPCKIKCKISSFLRHYSFTHSEPGHQKDASRPGCLTPWTIPFFQIFRHNCLHISQFPRACYVICVACLVYSDFMTKVETCSLIVETQDIRFSSKSGYVGPCDLIGNNKFYSWASFMGQINAPWRDCHSDIMPKDCSRF
jgi:hypothetical protein